MMKKVVLFLAAIAFITAAQAQFVVGVQGGYYWQKNSMSTSDDYTSSSNIVGCLQLGYNVTPKLYVGVMGGLINASIDTMIVTPHSYNYEGRDINIKDHMKSKSRSGWMVAPQVKYEVVRFGNMHFNLLLQGTLRMLGAVNRKQNYTTMINAGLPSNEYREVEPDDNHTTYMSWGVSLRPTLVYEFSPHISMELMLDLLSIGYINEKETYDPELSGIDPIDTKHEYFYAGLNSFTETLRWENSLLKMGFIFTF